MNHAVTQGESAPRPEAFCKPDRRGRNGKRQRKKNPPTGPAECGVERFCWLPLELVASPLLASLSINARRVLDRLMVEHVAQGGLLNGHLRVSYGEFVQAGASRRLISRALVELEAAGLVEVRRRGGDPPQGVPAEMAPQVPRRRRQL